MPLLDLECSQYAERIRRLGWFRQRREWFELMFCLFQIFDARSTRTGNGHALQEFEVIVEASLYEGDGTYNKEQMLVPGGKNVTRTPIESEQQGHWQATIEIDLLRAASMIGYFGRPLGATPRSGMGYRTPWPIRYIQPSSSSGGAICALGDG